MAFGDVKSLLYSLWCQIDTIARYSATDFYHSPLSEAVYWASQGGTPASITMSDILDVMVTATPNELQYFIGLVDAYRQSLWNKPFNQEFFAALARGFE